MSSSVPLVVSMTTFASGSAASMSRRAPTPSLPGMRMSRSVTSGFAFATNSAAPSPRGCSPANSMSLNILTANMRPMRTTEWSSITATRIFFIVPPPP